MTMKTKLELRHNFEDCVSFLVACQMATNRGHDCQYCSKRKECSWWQSIDTILDDYNAWKREKVNNFMEVR